MEDLIIRNVDNVHIKVVPENMGIAMELRDYCSFYVPNYIHMPEYKNSNWDGQIRLYSAFSGLIYRGLRSMVYQFAKERKYTIKDNTLDDSTTFTKEDLLDYLATLPLTNEHNATITPRTGQLVACYMALKHKRVTLVYPTASGKSLIIYILSRYLTDQNARVLIITNTTGLVVQMKQDFIDYSQQDAWDGEANTHTIFSGKDHFSSCPITISTWQSLHKHNQQYFKQYDAIFVDEAHGAKATSLVKILENCPDIEYRVGLTGTMHDAKAHHLVIEGLLGPAFTLSSTKEMMDRGEMSKLVINVIVLKHRKEDCKFRSYKDEAEFLSTLEKRNRWIAKLIASLPGNTISLAYRKNQVKTLAAMAAKYMKSKSLYLATGDVVVSEREKIRQLLETDTNAYINATYGVFSTGISIKNLHNGVFASPYKSKIKVLQSIGRGLRLHNSKEEFTLYDIADDLSTDDFENYGMRHLKSRMALYRKEGFSVNQITLQI